jgi:methylase of polypeptide subunit release factors
MIYTEPVSKNKIYYTKKVFDPRYSASDTIVLADKIISESNGACKRVVDVACGSGILGLAIKKLHPEVSVLMTDIDPEAIRITEHNAHKLSLGVVILEHDLLLGMDNYDMVIANLPTYDEEQLKDELHGPRVAYFGDGLKLYERLFSQFRGRVLVAECQERYQEAFLKLADKKRFDLILRNDRSFAFTPRPSLIMH